jgi:hypothetical protein
VLVPGWPPLLDPPGDPDTVARLLVVPVAPFAPLELAPGEPLEAPEMLDWRHPANASNAM